MAHADTCISPPSGLVSWWPGEGDGRDVVGGNNGILAGNVTFGTGRVGRGFVFDGRNGGVQVGNPASLQLQDLTIEGWVKRADASVVTYRWTGVGIIFGYGYGGYGFGMRNDGHLFLTKIGIDDSTLGAGITDTNFHHLAVTKSGSTVVFYIDGVAYTVPAYNSVFEFSTVAAIGAPGDYDLTDSFLGTIDELSVYGRALSGAEIQAIYNSGSVGKCRAAVPPSILTQPVNQTVTAGATATFSVTATGTPPLSYQWRLDGSDIAGATNNSLILTYVQFSQAGNYSVRVTNAFGSIVSFNAGLWVSELPVCDLPHSGLVGWWPLEGNANDLAGSNPGIISGTPDFAAGEVGEAMAFDGSTDQVRVPSSPVLDVGRTAGLTIETWIRPFDLSSQHPLVEWNDGAGFMGSHFWISVPFLNGGPGSLWANLVDVAGNPHQISSVPGLLRTNTFQHVAVTYDKAGGIGVLYLNGQAVAQTNLGSFTPYTSADLYLGYRPSGVAAGARYLGLMDEVSVYDRALTAGEIQAIYNASSAGKCAVVIPPSIVLAPASQSVSAGTTVTFTVVAAGTPPLRYQWRYNQANVAEATKATLVLTNVQSASAGSYSVLVSNGAGSALSINALLTVTPATPNCVPPPAGLVDWWRAEGNAADAVGGINGTLYNGTTFVPGEVGLAFSFDGVQNSVTNPAPGLTNILDSYAMEFWAKPTAGRTSTPEVTSGIAGISGQRFAIFPANGQLGPVGAGVSVGTNGISVFEHGAVYLASLLVYDAPITGWTHIAVVYVNRQPRLYVNGVLVRTGLTSTHSSYPSTWLGESGPDRVDSANGYYAGLLDEVSIYNRPLATTEIQAIYNAGSAGKCVVTVAPTMVLQPVSQTATLGANATFAVVAAGTPPFKYQWQFNAMNLAGATNASLTLTNVQVANAGTYAVVVSNPAGSVTSSNAVLTISSAGPAMVRVLSTNAPAGLVVGVPIALVARGNENALGFSLNFDPILLSYMGAQLGAGALGGTLVANAGAAAAGQIGLLVAMPFGTTFAAGTQQLVIVSFQLPSSVPGTNSTASILIGDTPIVRQLSDPQANPLPATFLGGSVSITPAGYEGDVWPRPNGDGLLTVSDWVQEGRFAAGLDQPAVGGEFERADCAPRATLGDGRITVSDWVQVGRYVAGLDPLTPAGGSTAPSPVAGAALHALKGQGVPLPVGVPILRVLNTTLLPGQTGTVSVELQAQGDENALGFSLAFDPAALSFAGVSLGSDAAGALLQMNTNQIAAGRLGVVLALPVGTSFASGNRQALAVSLCAAPAALGDYPVAFADQPVPRQMADATANALIADFQDGTLTVHPAVPALKVAGGGGTIVLAWPDWATNFLLQISDSAGHSANWTNATAIITATNGENTVTVPTLGQARFYRLLHP